jgi:hypothetical protein
MNNLLPTQLLITIASDPLRLIMAKFKTVNHSHRETLTLINTLPSYRACYRAQAYCVGEIFV